MVLSDYSAWFGLRSSASETWVDRVTFIFPSLQLCTFSHISLCPAAKSGGCSALEIPREILKNAHKGGPWMTLHMHRPRMNKTMWWHLKKKSLEIPLLLGWKIKEISVNLFLFLFLFFTFAFFYWIFNHCNFLDNTNAVILLYILSKLN